MIPNRTHRICFITLATALTGLNAQETAATIDDRQPRIYDLDGLIGDADQTPSGSAMFARLVRAFVQPALAPNESVQPIGERWIAVLGRPDQHTWVERFLAEAAGQRNDLWTTSCRLITLPEFTFQRDVAPALRSPTEPTVTPSSVVLEPGAATDAFEKALREHVDANELVAPVVTQRSLSPATISAVDQTAYVRDFDVQITTDSAIADPIIDVVEDGVTLLTSAMRLANGRVAVSIEAQVRDLQRPIPTFQTTLGVGHPITIQLPQVLSTEIESTVELPDDHLLLLALPPMAGKRYLLLVEVRPIAAAPAERGRD